MRYRGGGVGHVATRGYNSVLLNDEHTLLAGSQEMPEFEVNLDHESDHEDNAGVEWDKDHEEGLDVDLDLGTVDDTYLVTMAGFSFF